MTEPETVECKGLGEALEHIQGLETAANEAVGRYHEAVRQLTGIGPGKAMGPLDIVKIWQRLENPVND